MESKKTHEQKFLYKQFQTTDFLLTSARISQLEKEAAETKKRMSTELETSVTDQIKELKNELETQRNSHKTEKATFLKVSRIIMTRALPRSGITHLLTSDIFWEAFVKSFSYAINVYFNEFISANLRSRTKIRRVNS